MGENVTTRGVELLALPAGSRLHLGAQAVVELTGLRNPCVQLDRYQDGLMAAVLDRADILDIRSVCHDILIAPHVQDFAVQLVMATQPDQPEAHA